MMIKIANIMKRLRKDEKGFTLIELMVVIAVLGILAALIIPQFTSVNIKAYEANAKTNASAVATAAAMAFAEKGGGSAIVTTSDLPAFMSNYDDIEANYKVDIDADTVKLTGNNSPPNNIPDSVYATAKFK